MRKGDTTWTIAYLYYGPGHLKTLTEANPKIFLTGVPLIEVELEIGTALAIPPMPIPENEGLTELFDLVADPGEAHGASPADTMKAQELRARARGLRVWAAQQARQAAGPAPDALDEDTRAALRGLGYVE